MITSARHSRSHATARGKNTAGQQGASTARAKTSTSWAGGRIASAFSLTGPSVQTKVTVGKSDDRFEREADHMADRVQGGTQESSPGQAEHQTGDHAVQRAGGSPEPHDQSVQRAEEAPTHGEHQPGMPSVQRAAESGPETDQQPGVPNVQRQGADEEGEGGGGGAEEGAESGAEGEKGGEAEAGGGGPEGDAEGGAEGGGGAPGEKGAEGEEGGAGGPSEAEGESAAGGGGQGGPDAEAGGGEGGAEPEDEGAPGGAAEPVQTKRDDSKPEVQRTTDPESEKRQGPTHAEDKAQEETRYKSAHGAAHRQTDKPEHDTVHRKTDHAENQHPVQRNTEHAEAHQPVSRQTAEPEATVQRKAAGPDDHTRPLTGEPRTSGKAGMDAAAARAIHARGAGSPLPPAIRALMEPQFGVDFSEVRVHTSSEAQESAAALNAKAFTHRNHIWLGRNQSPSNVRLMAHELTHVVQQGSARPLHAASRTPVPQTLHPGPAKASTASGGKAMPVRPAAAPARVQRWNLIGFARSVGGAVVSGARAVGRAATRVVEGAMELARDALIAVVREIAPEFAELIERDGILGFLKKMVSKGISAVFGGVLDKIRGILHFDQIAGAVRRGVGAVSDVMGQLARNDCRGLNRAAKKVMDFFSRTFGPVIKKIRAIGGKIKDFVTGIVDTIAVPVFEFLSKVGGKLWQGIKAFIKKVGDIFGAIKSAIGKAWDKIKGWFGIGADEGSGEGGGLWNWIKKKAASAWSAISDVASRLSGPLKVVGGVLVALSPAGPVLAVIHFWPQLKRAFQWVVQKWNDMNIVVRARNYLNNTLLPMLHGALTSVSNGLQQAGDWIANTSQRIDSGLADAEGALGGSVILAPLKAVVSFLARGFRTLTTGVSGILRGAFARIRSVFVRLQEYIKPIWEAIKKIIAIAVNPFGIPGFLLGNIWKIIPNCIKGPLINFILRVLLRFVEALPPFIPPLGLLWPFIRSGLIGFLKKMLSFSVERKVKVSNKMGNIISGGSFGFAMGYLKGLALGLWDAIIGPFKGIADLFHLPELIRNFAHAMGEQFQNLVAQARRIINWVNERAGDTLQSLINSARDLLDHPARIIEMIKKAIEAALGAVQSLGASLAGQMMAIFEQPDEQIGEQLGNITGSTLASAVLSYFTAGAAGGASLIGRVAGVLSRIGKFLRPIIQGVLRYMPRVVSIVKKIANLFARAKSAASKFLGKIINFFKRIIGALKRALGKVKRFVKGVVAKVKKGYRRLRARIRLAMRKLGKRFWNSRLGKWLKKKFGKQLHAWHEFIKYVRRHVVAYRNTGVTKSQLKEILDAGKSQFKAGVLFTVIHRSGPKWGIKALPKAPAFPFSAKILMDPASRLKQAKGAIKRAVNRLPDESMSSALISEALLPIRMKYHFSQLDVVWNQAQEEWDIEGAMSPRQKLYWVKNLKGYHTGSASDPIPMYWYKLPGDYQPITLLHNGAPKTVSPGSYSMITAGGVTHRIGVGGTPVSQGTVLTRTPSIRLGAEKDFSTFLAAAGHSWLPDSPDHVKDLGFGGPDLFSNLWPISRAANQSFGFYGTRMRYKVRGQKNKVGRSTISHMMGKSFKVVGFKRKHPSPGGKDGQ